MSADGRYEAVR